MTIYLVQSIFSKEINRSLYLYYTMIYYDINMLMLNNNDAFLLSMSSIDWKVTYKLDCQE